MSIEQFSLFSGVVSICFAFWLRQNVAKTSEGNAKMIEIAEAIREGARAFLKREFKAIVWAGALLAIILYFSQKPNGLMVATGFIIGALASALASATSLKAKKRGLRSKTDCCCACTFTSGSDFKGGGAKSVQG